MEKGRDRFRVVENERSPAEVFPSPRNPKTGVDNIATRLCVTRQKADRFFRVPEALAERQACRLFRSFLGKNAGAVDEVHIRKGIRNLGNLFDILQETGTPSARLVIQHEKAI